MNQQYPKTGELQNKFTAMLLRAVERARGRYLEKRERSNFRESYLEDLYQEPAVEFEEVYEQHQRQQHLEKEAKGEYMQWDELTDVRLVEAIQRLKSHERQMLYMRIIQDKSLDEISRELNIPKHKVEGWYYYALSKVRKWMGGDLS